MQSNSRKSQNFVKLMLPLFVVGVLLIFWQTASVIGLINSILFSSPLQILEAFLQMVANGQLLSDLFSSLVRAGVGFLLGVSAGIVAGLITGRSAVAAATLNPLFHFCRSLPPVALIPLVILWFGIGETAKVFSIAFAVFFPVWVSTFLGVQRIPQVFLWSVKFLNKSRLAVLRQVVFPAALPFIIVGIRNAIALSLIMVFVSELAGASTGIGYRIAVSQAAYRADQMMAALALLGSLGILLDATFIFGTKKLYPWLQLNHQSA